MNYKKLAENLFGEKNNTISEIYEKYPKKQLLEGQKITRIAPSPTGFMHLGNLFGAIADKFLAEQSNGIFYLRIEDTDKKRSVAGGTDAILQAFDNFGITINEGVTKDGEIGEYGPYYQSKRGEIYKTFVYELIQQGKAYPCFASEQELANMRETQEKNKENYGYYGKYAISRDLSMDTILEKINDKIPFVIRFKSDGNIENKFKFTDMARGTLELTENNQDIVILKADGLPTYHFAHVIDDYLMGTTHVVRGEEWLATLPIHLQLFRALDLVAPKYIHTAQLMKLDEETGNKRKLSKRLDPELALDYYYKSGFPVGAVIEYLMTLLNSNFEEWRIKNPNEDIKKFPFSPKKMGASGALFDINKLKDISRTFISKLSSQEIYNQVSLWSTENDKEFHKLFTQNKDYTIEILDIGRGKPRKEITSFADIKPYMDFFYDEIFCPNYSLILENIDSKNILNDYKENFNIEMDNEQWFNSLKPIAEKYGYASETKIYKTQPEKYKGHVGDISMIIRVAIAGRTNSPDLYETQQVLGKEQTIKRLNKAIGEIK